MIKWAFRVQQQVTCALAVTTGGLFAAAYLSSPAFGMWAALAMGATAAISMAGVGDGDTWRYQHVSVDWVSVRYVPLRETAVGSDQQAGSTEASGTDAGTSPRNHTRI